MFSLLRTSIKFCLLAAIAFFAASAHAQINPANQINWPTCTSLQYYSPFDNTCHSSGGTPGGSSGNLQFNNASAFGGDANTNDDNAGNISAKSWITSCSGCAGYYKATAGTAPTGVAGAAIYSSDASTGFAEVNENNTGLSRLCTAGNGVCSGSTGNFINITDALTWTGAGATGGIATLSSSQTTITMAGIPGTYLHLRIVFSGTASAAAFVTAQFNGDSSTHYDYQHDAITNTFSGTQSNTQTSIQLAQVGTTGFAGGADILIMNYASSAAAKLVISNGGDFVSSTTYTEQNYRGEWRNTAALTSITFTCGTACAAGTNITVYGEN